MALECRVLHTFPFEEQDFELFQEGERVGVKLKGSRHKKYLDLKELDERLLHEFGVGSRTFQIRKGIRYLELRTLEQDYTQDIYVRCPGGYEEQNDDNRDIRGTRTVEFKDLEIGEKKSVVEIRFFEKGQEKFEDPDDTYKKCSGIWTDYNKRETRRMEINLKEGRIELSYSWQ